MNHSLGRIFCELPLSWTILLLLLIGAGILLAAVGAYGNNASFLALGLFFVLLGFIRANSVFMAEKLDELQNEIEVLRLALPQTRDAADN